MIPEAVAREIVRRVVVVLSRRLVRRILLAVRRTVPVVLRRRVRGGRQGWGRGGDVRGFVLLRRRRIDGMRRRRRAGRRGRDDLIPVIGSRPVASLPRLVGRSRGGGVERRGGPREEDGGWKVFVAAVVLRAVHSMDVLRPEVG